MRHVVVEPAEAEASRAEPSMASVAHAHDTAHEHPPEAHRSSRVDARLLGMYLFIASETMLFGSFFSIYFFDRVVVGGEAAAGRPRGSSCRSTSRS